ncbi:hypothetical protein [Verminephrobacter eiseniae]|uniref:hypothetical protein n=1 Tax=Verminephrobacter eiseniae TaxID=364317 RepID=UPI0038B22FF5
MPTVAQSGLPGREAIAWNGLPAPAGAPPKWLVSRHRSSVGLRWPSERIAALHRLPIRSVLAARCALRCAPMAARSLRHLIRDATLARLGVDLIPFLNRS